jgi:hypothetical protein
VGGGVQLNPLGTSATNWPIAPTPGDYEDGEFGGMMIGMGTRNTRRKPAPVPLCLPQIPHDLTGREAGPPWSVLDNCQLRLRHCSRGKRNYMPNLLPHYSDASLSHSLENRQLDISFKFCELRQIIQKTKAPQISCGGIYHEHYCNS